MSEPKAIDVLDFFKFSPIEKVVLHTMLNHEENDYSTVDELTQDGKLSQYIDEELREAVYELKNRGFLREVKKRGRLVFAVNKLRIFYMTFNYSR